MQMFNAEQLQEKWAPILDHDGLDPIKDSHRRAVTAILLENQENAIREEREFLSETPNVTPIQLQAPQVSLLMLLHQSQVSTQF